MSPYIYLSLLLVLGLISISDEAKQCGVTECTGTCWSCSKSPTSTVKICGTCSQDQYGCSSLGASCQNGMKCWKCTQDKGSTSAPFCATCNTA